ncbi:MAG: glycosyl hydrolase family 28 protein [Acidobacteriota bacterium]
MRYVCLALLLLSGTASAQTSAPLFNVLNYGARADGAANDAAAIQKAIDACARSGGGVVQLPAGNYVSGTLVLKTNVTLHLAPGATLWGSKKIDDYDPPHLIYAREAENIALEGGGTINGNGEAYWDSSFRPHERRPSPLIEFVKCRNVRIQDLSIRNAPGWTIHPLDCDGVKIRGISIVNHLRGPNTDGIDPDSSRNVAISDSYIEAGDDCIVLKTTGRGGGPARPCENVTVTNCTLVSDDAALKLGTESHGDFRHCLFSNCVISASRVGIAFYAKDGGTFEGISFSNITIDTRITHRESVVWPIFIDLEKRNEDWRQSRIRDVSFSDIVIHSKGRVLVGGMPDHPLENITFRNILMRVTGFEQVEKVAKPRGSSRVRPAGREIDYASVPAAFIFANVRGLNLRGIRVIWDTAAPPQERHAIYAARVEDLRIAEFSGRQAAPEGKLAVIGLDATKNVFITGSRAEAGAGVFVGLRGVGKDDVVLAGNDLKRARREVKQGATHVHLP